MASWLGLFLLPVATGAQTAPPPSAAEQLVLGQPVRKDIKADDRHRYQFTLQAGQYLYAEVEQLQFDLIVETHAPDGKLITVTDGPDGDIGTERLYLIAETTGSYQFDIIGPAGTKPGAFRITVKAVHSATDDNRHRMAGHLAYNEGQLLRIKPTREKLTQAIEKYKEAATHWKTVQSQLEETNAHIGIGQVYTAFGNSREALSRYLEALLLIRKQQNRFKEGPILNNIGAAYFNLGEPEKALEYIEQALPLYRQNKNRSGEAQAFNNLGVINRDRGDLHKALTHYLAALAIFQDVNYPNDEARTRSNLGQLFLELGEPERGYLYLNQALATQRENGDKRGEAGTLGTPWPFLLSTKR